MSSRCSAHSVHTLPIGVGIALMLLCQACGLKAPHKPAPHSMSDAVRTVRLADGGKVVIERTGEGERVELFEPGGASMGQSLCNAGAPGSYDQLVGLFRRLQKAVAANDRSAVAAQIHFPLQVNGDKSETIQTAAALQHQYQQVFNRQVVETIVKANPEAVFCRSEAAMFGDGVIWARTEDGQLAIAVVNH